MHPQVPGRAPDGLTRVNVAACLPEIAAARPDDRALAVPVGGGRYRFVTYRELDTESDRLARGLTSIGIGRGVRTVLMVKPSVELFSLCFAIAKVGAVPVLVDPGMGLANMQKCIAEVEPQAFIGVPTAHAARKLFGWGGAITVTVGRFALFGGYTLNQVRERGERAAGAGAVLADTGADETAAILFTSGSTGPPKGVVYTHGNFAAQIEILRAISGIGAGEVDLPTFPVFALFDPALGMTTVIPDMDPTRPASVDPRAIIGPIRDFGVTNMFASPALLDRVGRYGELHGVKLPSLKRVLSAGAPVPARVMERFLRMLGDDARIITPYGATEALPVSIVDSTELLRDDVRARTRDGAGVCIGRPVPGVEVSVIGIDDAAIPAWRAELELPAGQIGELVVRGRVVTGSYYGRPEATAAAKITDGDGDVRHRMGDLGYRDADGRLWFCGRKSQRVETGEATLYTVPCEQVLNAHPRVYRTALVGPRKQGRVVPVVCVELEPGAGAVDRPALARELRALAESRAVGQPVAAVLFHPGFPVDVRHNAKIGREALTAWAERQL